MVSQEVVFWECPGRKDQLKALQIQDCALARPLATLVQPDRGAPGCAQSLRSRHGELGLDSSHGTLARKLMSVEKEHFLTSQ